MMTSTAANQESQSDVSANGVPPVGGGGSDEQSAAWARAQEALKKVVSPTAPSHPTTPQTTLQATSAQYYPWMAAPQYGYPAPPSIPNPQAYPYYPYPPGMGNAFYAPQNTSNMPTGSPQQQQAQPSTGRYMRSTPMRPPPPPNMPGKGNSMRQNRPPQMQQQKFGGRGMMQGPPRPPTLIQPPAIGMGMGIGEGTVGSGGGQRFVRGAGQQQQQQPIRFNIGRGNQMVTPNAKAFPKNEAMPTQQPTAKPSIPDSVRGYIERAYAAVDTKEDRDKLEEYLRQKMNPLLTSGAAKNVDWDKEPLPSDVNFELKAQWTPASQVRKVESSQSWAGAGAGSWKRSPRDGYGSTPNRYGSTQGKYGSTQGKYGKDTPSRSPRGKERKRRVPSPTIPLVTSPDSRWSEDDENRRKEQANSQKSKGKKTKNKKQQKEADKSRWVADERSNARREERARRFARDETHAPQTRARRLEYWRDMAPSVADKDEAIVGTCQDIEKSFFRLTSAPDPSTVRPLHILERALKHVQRKYAVHQEYLYANDQLKSIRQDLMIQCIRTRFAVTVYETNARVAIEKGDREEFNQCQSQLKLLYAEVPNCANRHEFTAYRLLYYISVANTIDQTTLLSELDEEARSDECIKFALRVREAWALGNYVRLWKLYSQAPRMTSYVMDLFMDRERKAALNAYLKSYRPSIPVSVLSTKVGLSESKAVEWLAQFGISVSEGESVDCRQHSNAAT